MYHYSVHLSARHKFASAHVVSGDDAVLYRIHFRNYGRPAAAQRSPMAPAPRLAGHRCPPSRARRYSEYTQTFSRLEHTHRVLRDTAAPRY